MEKFKYTTFWDRFGAGLVDGFILMPIGLLLAFVFDFTSPVGWYIAGVIQVAIFYSYSILMHYKYGQTIGKRATSIRVIDHMEERMELTLQQAVLRDAVPLLFDVAILFVALISLITTNSFSDEYFNMPQSAWFLIEIFTMMTNHKRRAAHDFIAKTVVVKV